MRITIDKTSLETSINRVFGAVSEKGSGSVGLRAREGTLELVGSDKILSVYCTSPCRIEQEGFLYTQARFLADIVRELPAGDVLLETDGSWLTVTAGADQEFTIKLPLRQSPEWSEPPADLKGGEKARVLSKRLAYLIEQIQFCVSHESSRAFGVVGYLHKIARNRLRLVGTDSFRLSHSDAAFELPDDFLSQGICLSKRAMNELLKMCHEGFDELELSVSGDAGILQAQVEGYKIFILLSAVQFPRYEGVIPSKLESTVTVNRALIQGVSKRVLLAAGKTRVLHLLFRPGSLTLYAKNLGNSEGKEKISLAQYSGADCSLAINGKFLGDIFSTTASEELKIKFNNEEDPVVVVPVTEPESCRSRHILVPIRDSDGE